MADHVEVPLLPQPHQPGLHVARRGSARHRAEFRQPACPIAARWEAARTPGRPCVFIAADTGHRYAQSVYAHPRVNDPIDALAPNTIDDLGQLAFPWSVMDWGRRPFEPKNPES
ncbi:hypothetical protein ACFYZ9_26225 [Streptomyces sp. NPDC001691]|uniref:hypothetical protein n=1 Tax=Streptomyces sp. NPDC001691 TaxID=3364600 RepID=UPI0036AF7D8A